MFFWNDQWCQCHNVDQIEDVKDKPTRAQIETALIEGSKPDAEIDEEDEIPDKTSPTTKKRKASESNEGSKSVKKSRGDGSSNSDSSTVSSSLEKDTQGWLLSGRQKDKFENNSSESSFIFVSS